MSCVAGWKVSSKVLSGLELLKRQGFSRFADLMLRVCNIFKAHRIHGNGVSTYIYHKKSTSHVGDVYMDPMGFLPTLGSNSH